MPYLPSQNKEDLTIEVEEPLTKVEEPKEIEDEELVQLEVKSAKHDVKSEQIPR